MLSTETDESGHQHHRADERNDGAHTWLHCGFGQEGWVLRRVCQSARDGTLATTTLSGQMRRFIALIRMIHSAIHDHAVSDEKAKKMKPRPSFGTIAIPAGLMWHVASW